MVEANKDPLKCRYCGKALDRQGEVCRSCGYDPKTDTQVSSFVPRDENKDKPKKKSNLGTLIIIFLMLLGTFLFFNVFLKGTNIKDALTKLFDKDKAVDSARNKTTKKDPKSKGLEGVLKQIFPEKTIEDKRKELFIVEGIAFDPGKSLVLVNGEYYPEGGSLKNIKINKINRNSVEIIVGGESKTLEVSQSIRFPKEIPPDSKK